jgi:predicted N-acetyltransferase YhbS
MEPKTRWCANMISSAGRNEVPIPVPSVTAFDGVEVRQFGPSDSVRDLTHLLHRAYARLGSMGLRYMATHQSDEVTRERVSQGECYVALVGGALVGTIVFKPADRTGGCPWLDRPEIASLGQFAVAPERQALGLGACLMDLVEARAAEAGAEEIALDTAESAAHLVAWYGRRGYRLIEHAQWGHTNYRSVIMSKRVRRSEETWRPDV